MKEGRIDENEDKRFCRRPVLEEVARHYQPMVARDPDGSSVEELGMEGTQRHTDPSRIGSRNAGS
ncbi:MAG: hypothetical protein ACYCVC_18735 [Acidimicrobiales bacterium]